MHGPPARGSSARRSISSTETQVTVLEMVEKVLRLMNLSLTPDARAASNEIKHQYLSAAKAREKLEVVAPIHRLR